MIMSDAPKFKVVIEKDGPYAVSGGLPLSKEIIGTDKDGNSVKWLDTDKMLFAPVRRSGKKPYCDQYSLG